MAIGESSNSQSSTTTRNDTFQSLKSICVPLLSNSLLTPQNLQKVSSLLLQLSSLLDSISQRQQPTISPSTIEYVFFPISHILRRNDISSIPDVIMEKIMDVITKLVDRWWWWTCTVEVWDQLLTFAAAIFCGIDAEKANENLRQKNKDKTRARDDETRQASAECLKALLRRRTQQEAEYYNVDPNVRHALFVSQIIPMQNTRLFSTIGQTLTSLLDTSHSSNRTFQTLSLELIALLFDAYVPPDFFPTILPGVVSAISKVALGRHEKSKWAHGEGVVHRALEILQVVIVGAVNDAVCIRDGAIQSFESLDDLSEGVSTLDHERSAETKAKTLPFFTERTSIWLTATNSQLLIALNALSPLLRHPHPSALTALSNLSYAILSSTSQSFPEAHRPLLLYLLSLSSSSPSNTPFPEVQSLSKSHLVVLLTPPFAQHYILLKTFSRLMHNTLSSLPHLLSRTHSETQLIQTAYQIVAACDLASTTIPSISESIAKLLGPMGGIEKWGWRFLSVSNGGGDGNCGFRFGVPSVFVDPSLGVRPITGFFMEPQEQGGGGLGLHPFPELFMKFVESPQIVQDALDKLFRALGRAAAVPGAVSAVSSPAKNVAEACFAVEWFVGLGRKKICMHANSNTSLEAAIFRVSALWCTMRLLEGLAGIELGKKEEGDLGEREEEILRMLEKTCRWIVMSVIEIWDGDGEDEDENENGAPIPEAESDDHQLITHTQTEYVKGLNPLVTLFDMRNQSSTTAPLKNTQFLLEEQLTLQKVMSLRLLALTSSILRTQFSRLLLHVLYPLLHALTSSTPYLSSTALATLHHISYTSGYASPSNFLLANFDYPLDGAGRRLFRRAKGVFDPEGAMGVMKVLVRLVGRDVVTRAGDVVETCFERLEEFHGYSVVVDGAVGVLEEVVGVIAEGEREENSVVEEKGAMDCLKNFGEWYRERQKKKEEEEEEEDFGHAPRQDWTTLDKEKEGEGEGEGEGEAVQFQTDEKPLTPSQSLTTQILRHSLNLLTHPSAEIRARILGLIERAVQVLSIVESALLPAIHEAWPYVVNRLNDAEIYVIASAAGVIAALAERAGGFVGKRIWKDVWPRFKKILGEDDGGGGAARTVVRSQQQRQQQRRGKESISAYAYSSSNKLYCSILKTMTIVVKSEAGEGRDEEVWEVSCAFRRFLGSRSGSEEVRKLAKGFYYSLQGDVVWLVLHGSVGGGGLKEDMDWEKMAFLKEEVEEWDVEEGVRNVLELCEM